VVSGPILETRLHDFEFEWEDMVEYVCFGFWGFDAIENRKKICAFGRGLVEESEAGEAG